MSGIGMRYSTIMSKPAIPVQAIVVILVPNFLTMVPVANAPTNVPALKMIRMMETAAGSPMTTRA